MCGVAGLWAPERLADSTYRIAQSMTDRIAHRGPDDADVWSDAPAGLALGHRRLAIVELSDAGHQPMRSSSGRMVVAYNGELYNSADLRRELDQAGAAPNWRGHSDTETLVEAIEHWGVAKALERLNGMFAFALWDRREQVLTLARDRLGEKPLYYGRIGREFVFASELKALAAHPDFTASVNGAALSRFLQYNYVPTPLSIWDGLSKLEAAHFLQVRSGGRKIGEPTPYWNFREVAERGAADPLPDTPELVDQLESLLRDSVARRMEADVPLGAFLSGGIDSSTVVALMQAQSSRPVRTFTIGFDDRRHNEAVHAKAVAKHLGTEHTELYVQPHEALDLVPALPRIWDEPFADASQLPTYMVSSLARRHVTVSLSGDAGDELFAGYGRYSLGVRMRAWNARTPGSVRRLVASGLAAPSLARSLATAAGLIPGGRVLTLADRLPKLAPLLAEDTPGGLYDRLLSNPVDPVDLLASGEDPGAAALDSPRFGDYRELMMYTDTLRYLPDDILVKVDRASMAVSLESRVPFLDHRVVELAWRLPMSAKVRGGVGKHILREVLYRYVPRSLVERPKMGFSAPIDTWLRGPLRDWAESLLSEKSLREGGYFNPGQVRTLWTQHLRGDRNWRYSLWAILMFQAWLAESAMNPSARS
jgi:asparagine synthase (glutamine-hydrolysing)